MDSTTVSRALSAFGIAGARLVELSGGRINHTFLLQCDAGRFVLQEMNRRVFADPLRMTENARKLAVHLRAKGIMAPEYLLTEDGLTIFTNVTGRHFRAYAHIEGRTAGAGDVFATGRGWGAFHAAVSDFCADELAGTPDDFHDTPKRYAALLETAERNPERAEICRAELDFVRLHSGVFSTLTEQLKNGELPARVIHGDTKAANILLGRDGEPVGVIDLDTIQIGTWLYDFGDAVRSTCGQGGRLDRDALRAFTDGYLSAAGEMLTPTERESLNFAPWLIAMECGIRYLTDFIGGGGYFRAPEGCLNKARENFDLARDMAAR